MDIAGSNFETIRLTKKFINEIMPSIPSDYLKIYITGLSLNNNDKAKIADISSLLNMDDMIVISAFEYLQKFGLATIKNQDFVWVEFNTPYEQNEQTKEVYDSSSVLYQDKNYNDDLQQLFGTHIITSDEFRLIYDWTELFSLPHDVCLKLIEYCQDRKGQNTNIRYMHAVAKSWAQKQIDNIQAADAEIEKFERVSSGANKVLSYIGGVGRLPSKPEMDLYTKWVEQWGFTLDSILMAISNISATTNPSFKYVDKVLENLSQSGKTTSRTISEHMEKHDIKTTEFNEMLDLIGAKHSNLNYEKLKAFNDEGFSNKIIKLALKQASLREKHSLNYVETILYNWKSNGLDNEKAIKNDIDNRKDKRDKAYSFYKNAGLDGRLTQFQIETFEKWMFEDKFEYDMMVAVADYSKNTKNANQYMAKIFSSMKDKSIFTKSAFLDDIKNTNTAKPSAANSTTQYSDQEFQNMLTDID